MFRMTNKISRVEYQKLTLSEHDALSNPFAQLDRWWNDAISSNVHLLDAVQLATVDEYNCANARIVLLKSFDERGLVFYTNYESPKARELSNNPSACIIIFWPQVERQIRVRGLVAKTSRDESRAYFSTRPRGAQIGAWASKQSSLIGSRDDLEKSYKTIGEKFTDREIPCPDHWGGFRLVPNYFEFWQGRENRLHDRVSYTVVDEQKWDMHRLSP